MNRWIFMLQVVLVQCYVRSGHFQMSKFKDTIRHCYSKEFSTFHEVTWWGCRVSGPEANSWCLYIIIWVFFCKPFWGWYLNVTVTHRTQHTNLKQKVHSTWILKKINSLEPLYRYGRIKETNRWVLGHLETSNSESHYHVVLKGQVKKQWSEPDMK